MRKLNIVMGCKGMCICEEDGLFLIEGLGGNPFYTKREFDATLHVVVERNYPVPSELYPCVDAFLRRNYI